MYSIICANMLRELFIEHVTLIVSHLTECSPPCSLLNEDVHGGATCHHLHVPRQVVNAPRLPWWRRLLWGQGDGDLIDEDEDVAEDQAHGVRTRVNPGGREATKATRREAKKRARTESRQSKEALAAKEWRRRQQDEVSIRWVSGRLNQVWRSSENALDNEASWSLDTRHATKHPTLLCAHEVESVVIIYKDHQGQS